MESWSGRGALFGGSVLLLLFPADRLAFSRNSSPKGSGPSPGPSRSIFSKSDLVNPGFISSPVTSPKNWVPQPTPLVIQAGLLSRCAPLYLSSGGPGTASFAGRCESRPPSRPLRSRPSRSRLRPPRRDRERRLAERDLRERERRRRERERLRERSRGRRERERERRALRRRERERRPGLRLAAAEGSSGGFCPPSSVGGGPAAGTVGGGACCSAGGGLASASGGR
mmetsp:Transcript_92747/g.286350  ORF Transcript_92747/g.286350 Transcript_92747/m.286350 type:complete len:226 (+) Transcript_92747:697-1374(+)